MTIDRETTLCVSIAARPSNIGAAVHNAGYVALGLNFIYCPCTTTNLPAAINGVRALGIRGCSVSMPFKQTVIALLDRLSDSAAEVGAVNTIVNAGGKLTGYNTDVDSVTWALRREGVGTRDRVLVLGIGGMARACITALRRVGVGEIVIAGRSPGRHAEVSVRVIPWESRLQEKADVLINATPIGMMPDEAAMPMPGNRLTNFRLVIDAVASPPESLLCRESRAHGIPVVAGHELALRQAMAQFSQYTGVPAPEIAMAAALADVVAAR